MERSLSSFDSSFTSLHLPVVTRSIITLPRLSSEFLIRSIVKSLIKVQKTSAHSRCSSSCCCRWHLKEAAALPTEILKSLASLFFRLWNCRGLDTDCNSVLIFYILYFSLNGLNGSEMQVIPIKKGDCLKLEEENATQCCWQL